MDWITIIIDFIGRNLLPIFGVSGGVVIAWVLRKIPNDKIQAVVGKFFYALGVTMTLGLAKWKYTAPFWESKIEPWFIDLVKNIVNTALDSWETGMRSNNTIEMRKNGD